MHFDLPTLYHLAVGTLLLSAGMTLMERQVSRSRRRELGTLAAGYVTLAVGCVVATARADLYGASGTALASLIIVSGYLLILDGVASLSGRQYRTASLALVAALTLAWVIGGTRWQYGFWTYVSAIPVALANGISAWEVLRSDQLRSLRAGRVVAAVTGGHALLYAARALLLPVLALYLGDHIVSAIGKLTIYEGVLYSVCLPMTLLALIREESENQLLKASRTDHLTELGNRRWFFEEGTRLLHGGASPQQASLLVIDLDHFKAINDLYGHATGDDVLRTFARVAEHVFSSGAILARIGGEEFAALLPGQDADDGIKVGQTLADAFTKAVALSFDGIPLNATVSIGLAQFGADGTDLDSLLAAADRGLYVAKALGRNRIELARSIPMAPGRDQVHLGVSARR